SARRGSQVHGGRALPAPPPRAVQYAGGSRRSRGGCPPGGEADERGGTMPYEPDIELMKDLPVGLDPETALWIQRVVLRATGDWLRQVALPALVAQMPAAFAASIRPQLEACFKELAEANAAVIRDLGAEGDEWKNERPDQEEE